MPTRHRALLAAAFVLTGTTVALAQPADTLRDAARKAIAGSPDVAARFNAFRAATDAVDVARGGLLPKIDLNASVGRDSDKIDTRLPPNQSLSRSSIGLSLTQLLWDGLGTRNEVMRFGHERLARYFELLDVTEQTTLEAARAHYDVQRYRRLVQLAEDNYVQHRYAYLQIEARVKAGVGRGVDLEQAAARLALAESNLATEQANLHDVTARYQRIVGEAPPAELTAVVPLRSDVAADANAATGEAISRSAAISAGIEGLRAARAQAKQAEGAWQPLVQARVRTDAGKNVDGVQEQKRNTSAEIVMRWNLYNGGADTARIRQQANLVSQAADLRDKTCRDVRQTAAIAYNDTRKLAEQLAYLQRNTLSIEKARDAYRQQFDIGQRSLLDLLNAENEVYTARRALANAEHDLAVAYARVQAAGNRLGTQLGISRTDAAAEEAAAWTAGDDAPTRCPIGTTTIPPTDRAALDARAARMQANAPAPAVPAPTPVPAPKR